METENKLCFFLELIPGGELFSHLKKTLTMDEEKSKFYISEIICAIQYLHEKKILYRDLKFENILL